ncbi:AGE1 [[Candida] subhashii]|uniref:ADP-ribosylation factor GTPase-activating protein n=1 Tax=[Candida] subhashii TaxID=561895 RepID=A0A8J5QJ57_9ASCO|nr:AGE1 [[Candida] subhashii]KAG7664017.1 AGE1 [[Candida] subhashii]
METLRRISFPYCELSNSHVSLKKLVLTDEPSSIRRSISLHDNKAIESIEMEYSDSHQATRDLTHYIENPDVSEKDEFPLLIKVNPALHKLKLHVLIKPTNRFKERSLIIVKSTGNYDIQTLKHHLYDDSCTDEMIEISKIDFDKLPLNEDDENFQKLIINDSFDNAAIRNTKLNISLWENDPATNEYEYLLNFGFWVDDFPKEDLVSPANLQDQSPTRSPISNKPEDRLFNVGDFRREFNFNIEDGPEFRKTLAYYEDRIPRAKKIYSTLIGEFKNLEQGLRKFSSSKMRIIEGINALIDLQSNSLLKDFGFMLNFSLIFKSIFDPFEANLSFFLNEVCDAKLFNKLAHNLATLQDSTGSSGSSSASNSPSNHNELVQSKKQFENDSKEYYSWLNKYLSNEKERPESKLLLKRKAFEMSKFDYLNHLSKTTNNQYVNVLWENLFKFIHLRYDVKNPRVLEFAKYKDKKQSQDLIGGNYKTYLHALLRFNSEKYKFRQMIEASTSNEELTTLIRYNTLNHKQMKPAKHVASDDSITTTIDEFVITNENIDLIFSDSHPPSETVSQTSDSEMTGILFTLGGQGKQGWHKEWVVLKKGQLTEYADWRKGKKPLNKPIEVALSSVKPITYDKRQFCFEILTSRGTKNVFQAINEDERTKWIKALYNAAQVVNTQRLDAVYSKNKASGNQFKVTDKRKNLGRLITDLVEKPVIPGQSKDRSISPVSITSRTTILEKDYFNLVKSIPDSDNNKCVDCNSTESVEWISINTLSCFCVQCASCHRSIGSHITKIRSLKLDKFENELEMLLSYTNNRYVNSFLEENMPPGEKIQPDTVNEKRLSFIRNKYVLKKYKSIIPDVNNLLIRSIQRINIHGVLKNILCGGDVNVNIQINIPNKNEYLVISLFEYSLRKFVEIKDESMFLTNSKKLFVISELLILNGCKVDLTHELNKEIGLTNEALEYWKLRSLKLSGGLLTP